MLFLIPAIHFECLLQYQRYVDQAIGLRQGLLNLGLELPVYSILQL